MSKFPVLNENTQFRTLYYRGKSQVHPALVTYVRRNRLGYARAGITAGKKIGDAVVRNRCRRIIREAYRAVLPSIRGGDGTSYLSRAGGPLRSKAHRCGRSWRHSCAPPGCWILPLPAALPFRRAPPVQYRGMGKHETAVNRADPLLSARDFPP